MNSSGKYLNKKPVSALHFERLDQFDAGRSLITLRVSKTSQAVIL